MTPRRSISEPMLLLLIGLVHFVNILDFIMITPLGPDFARALDIDNSKLGLLAGSYAAAAAVAGILGAFFLDRFDRRKALGTALAGLVVATALGGLSVGFGSLLFARLLAGAFGGPATSLSLAIVTDVVPVSRRGRALGTIMGAFSVASVLGVPAGLELARLGGWRMPFFAVAGLGAVVAAFAVALMPPLTGHRRQAAHVSLQASWRRTTVLLSLGATALVMLANFALIPNLSAFWQYNAGYPRERLGLLYMVGGAVSFVTMRICGRLVDRFGATAVASLSTAAYIPVLLLSFMGAAPSAPVMVLFVAFMVTGTFRMIPMRTLSTRVPEPHERARFLSLQSSVQHMASAVGAVLGAQILSEGPGGRLVGMDDVAWLAISLAAVLPVIIWMVETRVQRRQAVEAPQTREAAAL